MADAADGPEEAVDTGCGRVVDRPAVGSALPEGHMPLVGFLRVVHPFESAVPVVPFVCCDEADNVDWDEVELREDEELLRWAVFRGPGINILLISSEVIPFKPLCPPLTLFHPGLCWKVRGGATAVIWWDKEAEL